MASDCMEGGDCCKNSALYRICTLLFTEAARLGLGTAAHVTAPVPELELTHEDQPPGEGAGGRAAFGFGFCVLC